MRHPIGRVGAMVVVLVLAFLGRAGADGRRAHLVAIGPEERVNTSTRGTQVGQQVAIDARGRSVVVWMSYTSSDSHVFFRRYGADGAPRGKPVQVDYPDDHAAITPTVAVTGNGEFVIAWGNQEEGYFGPMARVYSADGHARTPPFAVATGADNPGPVDVAINRRGVVAIAWCVEESPGTTS